MADFGLEPEFVSHNTMRGLSGGQKVKIVLGAATDAEWSALATVAALGWGSDERFATASARQANATALDSAIAAWTVGHDNATLAARLQAAGVAAAPVLRPGQLDDDGHLLARGSRVELAREEAAERMHRMARDGASEIGAFKNDCIKADSRLQGAAHPLFCR